MVRSHLEVSFANSQSFSQRVPHTCTQTINARYRSAANSGTLKPRGVFNAKDNQFIKEIQGFYKKLKKRVKAHSDKVDGRESPVGDSPDEQDQISEATADKEDETVIRDGFIDPSHEVCDSLAPTSLTKTARPLKIVLTMSRTISARRLASTSMTSWREALPTLSPSLVSPVTCFSLARRDRLLLLPNRPSTLTPFEWSRHFVISIFPTQSALSTK